MMGRGRRRLRRSCEFARVRRAEPGLKPLILGGCIHRAKARCFHPRSRNIASFECCIHRTKRRCFHLEQQIPRLLPRLDQAVVFFQHLLKFGVRNGADFEVVNAFHGLGGDQGVDYRLLYRLHRRQE
jgi:hypothetical protein